MRVELQSCKAGSANWLKEFYLKADYKRSVSDEDDVYFAELNGQKIGVLRISKEYGFSVLRGMQVLETYRGQGIGTNLLTFLQSKVGPGQMYCIPSDHLVNFYGQIGFEVIDPNDAPGFLFERVNGYIERGFKVVIMKRENAS